MTYIYVKCIYTRTRNIDTLLSIWSADVLFVCALQWLFVAEIDNLETSACIISPQQVKYEHLYLLELLVFV